MGDQHPIPPGRMAEDKRLAARGSEATCRRILPLHCSGPEEIKLSRNVEAYSALRDLPDEFLVGFCLACAERGNGVLAPLGAPEELEWSSRVLDLAWKAPLGEVEEDELAEILEEFELRSESIDMGDPGSKGFTVLQSMMLVVNAIAVYMNPSPARAEMSGNTLETILGSFDFKLGGSQIVIIEAGSQEEVGRLQRLEQEAQNAYIESVVPSTDGQAATRLDRIFLDSLRASCAPIRDEIAVATESVAELAGWHDE